MPDVSSLEPLAAREIGTADPGRLLIRAIHAPATAWVLLAIAVLQQCLGHHNGDNSWLISVAEALLQGARPYVDLVETNPPGAFLIYVPAAALAKLLHLSTELVASTMIFAGGMAVLFWLRKLLLGAGLLQLQDGALFLNAGVFALLVLPGFSFGEREHLAVICVLPIVTLYVLRDGGARLSPGTALLAGLLAAFAVIAKPHFVLAVLLPFGWLLTRQRKPSLIFAPENLMAVVVCAAYVASLPAAFPHFFDALPAIVDVYVPVRTPWPIMLTKPWFLLNLALLGAVLVGTRRHGASPFVQVLMLASTGFLIAFLLQVKGWVNHGLPGDSMALFAAAMAVGPVLRNADHDPAWQTLRRPSIFVLLPALFGAPILFGMIIQFSGWEEYDGLTAAVRRHGPAHPRIATITSELDLGHPLVRRVDGVWVMRPHSLWLMANAMTLLQDTQPSPEMRARLQDYIARDAQQFREDVIANRPDLIIAASAEEIAPILRHPDITAALRGYVAAETVGKLTLYARRD